MDKFYFTSKKESLISWSACARRGQWMRMTIQHRASILLTVEAFDEDKQTDAIEEEEYNDVSAVVLDVVSHSHEPIDETVWRSHQPISDAFRLQATPLRADVTTADVIARDVTAGNTICQQRV